MSRNLLKTAVVGATGYTGLEIVKLLLNHGGVEIASLTAKVEETTGIDRIFPQLWGRLEMECSNLDVDDVCRKADLVFLALPHTVSMLFAPRFLEAGKKVIDLSADYRFPSAADFEKWYGSPHRDPEGTGQAVYGLPELFREEIGAARLLANPGCYPTASILACYPVIQAGLASPEGIIVDAKTGVTGAGRKASLLFLFPEVNENFKAYSLGSHKHTPEMEDVLSRATGRKVRLEFAPHLLPVNRGILSTIYLKLEQDVDEGDLYDLYRGHYGEEPFVRVYPAGQLPELRDAVGTNNCLIGFKINPRTGNLIVVSAIDNLLKGAAGQAVQNMNIMQSFPETEGLI
jgi:N-acetyl-gamma-glutamyl-phosphate reductase